jgi:uracil-DNA glycosylase
LSTDIPAGWREALGGETRLPYYAALQAFVRDERAAHAVYPPEDEVFTALGLTPFEQVRVVILGQDPYHGEGQAHGLAFSVRAGVRPPPSLVNMYKEMETDLGVARPATGDLTPWARQGVLLLNAVLTVRASEANSHAGWGWERFTDAALRALNARAAPVVFVLWGNYARKKRALIDAGQHTVIESAHPSPLSARNGFFGSRPFSKINAALRASSQAGIDWRLPGG